VLCFEKKQCQEKLNILEGGGYFRGGGLF